MRIQLPAMAWFGILFVIVLGLAMTVPPNPAGLAALHVALPTYRLLIFLILLPYGLAWASAFYAYASLGEYARRITDTLEGRGFDWIVRSLKILAWGLILSALISQLLALIRAIDPAFTAAQTIINRYLTLGVTIGAFVSFQNGTFILSESTRARRSRFSTRSLTLIVAVIGVVFVELVTHNLQRSNNPYILPLPILLATVVIPYIYIWTLGFIGINELRLYARRVRGILYQRALQTVANGMSLVILLSIASQYITAAFAGKSAFSLGWLLIVVYILLLFQAIGLVLVSIGAKQLKKIEVV